MGQHSVPEAWEEHHHEAIVHTHPHYHVTHNYNDLTTGFDHLSSAHAHEHDHGELTHAHHPHRDFEDEHGGEAHVHDHEAPVKLEALKDDAARRRARSATGVTREKTAAKRSTT